MSHHNGEELLEEEAEEFSEESANLAGEQNAEDQSGDDDEDSSEGGAAEDEIPWITWFINIRGNEFFCEVEESFIEDDFNLTGLSSQVPYYNHALNLILDGELSVGTLFVSFLSCTTFIYSWIIFGLIDSLTDEQQDIIETAAEVLYGLIHARYILTASGMQKMVMSSIFFVMYNVSCLWFVVYSLWLQYEKYQNVDFGRCPRSFCQGQPVLPVGLSDITREFSVEVFCPRCQDTYHPRSSKHANIDGAYFGSTFCHLFLLTHSELIVPKPTESYVPRIFGFRIHESSQYHRLRLVALIIIIIVIVVVVMLLLLFIIILYF